MGNTTLEREILPLLVTCALVYQTNQTPEELSILADIFAEDLEKENLESITNAFALHRRRSTRFPTPAHIIAILPECRVCQNLKPCRKQQRAGRPRAQEDWRLKP